ncbi:MAG: UDP-glucose 4-epimerase GalE [Candidatus Aminicenantes bacterium]|nr:UDP-glucose 4-epimerase GalE [Candidatus Aminicenantes bacterium]
MSQADPGSVLVAGGAGYIGSHVSKALAIAGYHPVVLDNLSTGNAAHVVDFPLIHADIADTGRVVSLIREHKIRALLHFAASIQVEESVRFPLDYYENNVCRTLRLLRTCSKNGVRTVVFSSTAAVYGSPEKLPVSEDAALNPINPYGRSKMMVEMMLKDMAAALPDFHFAALRYFNVAGADRGGRIGQSYPKATHLITLALRTALGLRPELVIFGTDYATADGTAVRDYIDIEDIAFLHVRALDALFERPRNLVLNCGYGHGFSVNEVVQTVKRVTGIDFPVHETGRRPGDPPVLVADSSRAKNELNWTPMHDKLEEIIRAAWEWERKLHSMKAIQ